MEHLWCNCFIKCWWLLFFLCVALDCGSGLWRQFEVMMPFKNLSQVTNKSQKELHHHSWTFHSIWSAAAKLTTTSVFRVDFEIYKKLWNTWIPMMQLLHQMLVTLFFLSVTLEVGANSELWCHTHDHCQDFPQGAQKCLNNFTIMSGEHHITYDYQQLQPNMKSILLLQLLRPLCFSLHWSIACFSNPFSCTSYNDSKMCPKNVHKNSAPRLNEM